MEFTPQHDQMDCGPACLAMIASEYGKKYSLTYLRDNSFITRDGVSLLGIKEAATKIGFNTLASLVYVSDLPNGTLPCILYWNQNHFVVLTKITKNVFTKKYRFKIADPAFGFVSLSEEAFKKSWVTDEGNGIVLFLEPTDKFYEFTPPKETKLSLKFILQYLKPFKVQVSYLFLLLLLGSGITLIFPFLTQNLIDRGVNGKNLSIITIILLAQLSLYLGGISMEIIRNWLMLNIGSKISISIISDFLKKLLQLPIKFFDTKLMGDFNQRIQDNERIESFLTSQTLVTFFSMLTFTVFFGVLWYYDFTILCIYLLLTIFSISWSIYWLRKIRIVDYYKFQVRSENQESIYEIINGVTELKLNQYENLKRKNWETIQLRLFHINKRVLRMDQFQLSGFEFINQIKNILVTFMAATYVVKGTLTLGELLSVSYIVGQMNTPLSQLVTFFRSFQNAKLSLERLNEVQNHHEEDSFESVKFEMPVQNAPGINLQDVSFRYEGANSNYVLKNINMQIPAGKITAIVGSSGSGKTTLLKLLLKFYDCSTGEILYNNVNIKDIAAKDLRSQCGVVMQDGFIFSDTIERNIATGDEFIDMDKVKSAIEVANIEEFIESLPLNLSTKIGASGNGISGGQTQRLLIARSVYKDPHYIFFDEATSALDAENEKVIHNNLQSFFKDRTVVIIAHRLSTVRNADQIIVLSEGQIVERGTHQELVKNKNNYYNLIKNQLELGN